MRRLRCPRHPRRLRRLLWRRGVLPEELRDRRVAFSLGVLQGSVAVFVEQLGVGLCSQQGLQARLVPFTTAAYIGGR